MKGRRGGVLALVVLLLPVLMLLFGVIVVDFGLLSLQAAKIQHAADAGALAGAGVLTTGDTAAAEAAAERLARLNWPRSGLAVGVTVAAGETVAVSLSATVPLLFAPTIGIREATVGARAAANADEGAAKLVE